MHALCNQIKTVQVINLMNYTIKYKTIHVCKVEPHDVKDMVAESKRVYSFHSTSWRTDRGNFPFERNINMSAYRHSRISAYNCIYTYEK